MIRSQEVFDRGMAEGEGILSSVTLGDLLRWHRERCVREGAGYSPLSCEDVQAFVADCEMCARDYSPFEFFAAEINRSRRADSLWADYEDGIRYGVKLAWWNMVACGGECE